MRIGRSAAKTLDLQLATLARLAGELIRASPDPAYHAGRLLILVGSQMQTRPPPASPGRAGNGLSPQKGA